MTGVQTCALPIYWIPQSETLLNGVLVPGLHNLITRIPPVVAALTPYAAVYELNWLSASGTACVLATLTTAVVLRVSPRRVVGVYAATFKQLSKPMLTIASMLGLAYLMNYSGMTSTLGLALARSGRAFPFFSATLGWIGVFLTGSDTSSNVLFGNLQKVTAEQLGFSPVLMCASNSSGGVMGMTTGTIPGAAIRSTVAAVVPRTLVPEKGKKGAGL
mgnify:CR=1 FL=1